MTQPTSLAISEAARNAHLWEILLNRLHDCDQSEAQLEALRAIAQLTDDELPIDAIAETVLTQTSDEDGTFYFDESDDFWGESIEVLQRAPERMSLDPLIEVLVAVFEHGTDAAQILDFLARFAGKIDPQHFADLLTEDAPELRQAGLEALYQFDVVAPILTVLADPDPETRALAIENAWLLGGMTQQQLQAIADDVTQPLEARGMAARYLEKTTATVGA